MLKCKRTRPRTGESQDLSSKPWLIPNKPTHPLPPAQPSVLLFDSCPHCYSPGILSYGPRVLLSPPLSLCLGSNQSPGLDCPLKGPSRWPGLHSHGQDLCPGRFLVRQCSCGCPVLSTAPLTGGRTLLGPLLDSEGAPQHLRNRVGTPPPAPSIWGLSCLQGFPPSSRVGPTHFA